MVFKSLSYLCEALVSCEKQLNIIDSEAGDGDTGLYFKSTLMNVIYII